MLVAGVDGCPGGWLVIRAESVSRLQFVDATVLGTFAEVQRHARDAEAIGIDVPIGLPDDGTPRAADVSARTVLGVRKNSVFPAPVRGCLTAKTYADACAESFRLTGRKISKQAYNGLLGRVYELDCLMAQDQSLQECVVEVHPEVCFWALNDRKPMAHYKKTREGQAERTELLVAQFGEDLRGMRSPRGSVSDDLLDACAAAWSAARFAAGHHGTLPADPPIDSRGLRMEIVY